MISSTSSSYAKIDIAGPNRDARKPSDYDGSSSSKDRGSWRLHWQPVDKSSGSCSNSSQKGFTNGK